jgi:hypothetical protein
MPNDTIADTQRKARRPVVNIMMRLPGVLIRHFAGIRQLCYFNNIRMG